MNSLVSRSTINWLLFLSDIFGVVLCFHLAFSLKMGKLFDEVQAGSVVSRRSTLDSGTPITAEVGLRGIFNPHARADLRSIVKRWCNGNWRTPWLYRLIIVYLSGLYWANTVKLGRSMSTFCTCSLFCLAILATIGVISFCIYLTGFWGRTLLFGRSVLLNNQLFLNIFSHLQKNLIISCTATIYPFFGFLWVVSC